MTVSVITLPSTSVPVTRADAPASDGVVPAVTNAICRGVSAIAFTPAELKEVVVRSVVTLAVAARSEVLEVAIGFVNSST